VKDLEGGLRQVREELAVARADLAHDRAHVDEVAKRGPKTPCPDCKKPYGEDYDEILGGYRSRIVGSEALVPMLKEKCQRLEKRLDKAREAHNTASAAARKLADTRGLEDAATAGDELVAMERELRKIDDRLRALTTEIPALSGKCKADEECGETWRELSATCKEKKKGVDRALKALDRNSYSKTAHTKAQEAYERAFAVNHEVSSLREATADTAHLKTELEKQTKRVEVAKTDRGKTEQELRQLAFDTERLGAIKDAAKNADDSREAAQDALTQARLEAQSRSSEVKALRDRLADSKKVQDAVAAAKTTKSASTRSRPTSFEVPRSAGEARVAAA
jgi:DNA repair exonuclease SbcCD ATPase subunit